MATANDKVLDAITGHSVDLVRLESSLKSDVIKQLKTLEASLIKKLNATNLETTSTQLKRKRQAALLSQTKATIRESYALIDAKEATNMTSVAGIAESQAVSAINGAINAQVLSVGMSDQMLGSIASNTLIQGAPSKEWWAGQGDALQKDFKHVIRQSMLAGETTSQIVQKIRGTKALGYNDGIMNTARNRAQALVRTSVQVVANEARMRTYDANDDIVRGIEWVSTLDSRTSAICQFLDHKKWNTKRHPMGHSKKFPGPTAHWNCRSTQVPILKSWGELGSKQKFKEIPKSTRASMDGQVSSKIGYEKWLKGKDKAFQMDVLGPGKWDLWQAGKVGFKDLVDQSGNPVSLANLKTKLNIVPPVVKPTPPVVVYNLEGTRKYEEYENLVQEVTGAIPPGKLDVGSEISSSISSYTSIAFNDINDHLRGHASRLNSDSIANAKFHIGPIDEFMDSMPPTIAPFKVFRSRRTDKNHKVGDVVTDNAYGSSTTRRENIGFGNVMYDITVPVGSKVGPISRLSAFGNEAEILLPRGYKLAITKIERQGGITKYDATLMQD
jgi:SPP1 gp7 family putative phage head morphogenesis protein